MVQPVIIRIEIERMKESISAVIDQRHLDISAQVQKGLDEALAAEHVQNLIENTTREVVQKRIKDAVKSFFDYGDGGRAIEAAVKKSLREQLATLIPEEL
jgi:hypothetical protein